jgi:hypothetical protein
LKNDDNKGLDAQEQVLPFEYTWDALGRAEHHLRYNMQDKHHHHLDSPT